MKFGESHSSTKVILREWYEKNKRDLPWRQNTDPYRIWLSEIILQQTRVAQGLSYYQKFIRTFPTVDSLAGADEQEILLLWQGLGYYSRARNLHRAAKTVAYEMKGRFPNSYEGLLKLRGVGPYTAAAIASICFGEARAVVDGNVSRVIARLYGLEEPVNGGPGGRMVASLARELLDEDPEMDPGAHNQAVMEFGALQCTPLSPDCPACPLNARCQAYLTDKVKSLPVKNPRRKPVDQWLYFFMVSDGERILLEQRGVDDIWKSMFQFPMAQFPSPVELEKIPEVLQETIGKDLCTGDLQISEISPEVRHQLSHRTLHARFIHIHAPTSLPGNTHENKRMNEIREPEPLVPFTVGLGELSSYPLPRLISRYLEGK